MFEIWQRYKMTTPGLFKSVPRVLGRDAAESECQRLQHVFPGHVFWIK